MSEDFKEQAEMYAFSKRYQSNHKYDYQSSKEGFIKGYQKAQEEKQELIDTLLELNEKCLRILHNKPVREFDHLQSRIEQLTKKQK